MPRVNLQGYPRAQRRVETRSFDLPNGDTLTLTFRATDTYDALVVSARAKELVADLNGDYYPLTNGEAVPLEPGIAEVVVGLEAMQPESVPEEDRYPIGDFLALMVSEELAGVWMQVAEWVEELNAKAEEGADAKNSPAGPTGRGSATSSRKPARTPSPSTTKA